MFVRKPFAQQKLVSYIGVVMVEKSAAVHYVMCLAGFLRVCREMNIGNFVYTYKGSNDRIET